MDKIRVAIVGCGNVSKRHFEAINNNDNCMLVACCDNISAKADEKAESYNINAYYSFDEMLENAHFPALGRNSGDGRLG